MSKLEIIVDCSSKFLCLLKSCVNLEKVSNLSSCQATCILACTLFWRNKNNEPPNCKTEPESKVWWPDNKHLKVKERSLKCLKEVLKSICFQWCLTFLKLFSKLSMTFPDLICQHKLSFAPVILLVQWYCLRRSQNSLAGCSVACAGAITYVWGKYVRIWLPRKFTWVVHLDIWRVFLYHLCHSYCSCVLLQPASQPLLNFIYMPLSKIQ